MQGKKRGKHRGTQQARYLTERVDLSAVAVNPNDFLESDGGVAGDAVPGLAGAHVEVIQAVQVMVLDVPREPAEEHGNVDHRGSNARNLLFHEL